ncbi:hypothetical protein NC653_025534 [Populus alba x Populus x berolinensis]|uniref:Uncharacterized protein n=1 Tax=Populus alba x Populus x berolinensis TaxID=444605 RepID=A0AAD6MBH2_9ROSI|nr:hypothetical protein NC653_025534 [Populus alba x Populus x berolinensis]
MKKIRSSGRIFFFDSLFPLWFVFFIYSFCSVAEKIKEPHQRKQKTSQRLGKLQREQREPAQKIVTVKPEPEKVIKIISLGTEEKPVNKKKEGEGSTKKTKPTLSSVETAGREEEETTKENVRYLINFLSYYTSFLNTFTNFAILKKKPARKT